MPDWRSSVVAKPATDPGPALIELSDMLPADEGEQPTAGDAKARLAHAAGPRFRPTTASTWGFTNTAAGGRVPAGTSTTLVRVTFHVTVDHRGVWLVPLAGPRPARRGGRHRALPAHRLSPVAARRTPKTISMISHVIASWCEVRARHRGHGG